MTQVDDKPWLHESDGKGWRHAGLYCIILRHGFTKTLCGYVTIPAGHPCLNLSMDQAQETFDVHGEITFFGKNPHRLPGDKMYLGFDCAHGGLDFMPGTDFDMFHLVPTDETPYRTMDWVTQETNRLAEQVAAYGITHEDESDPDAPKDGLRIKGNDMNWRIQKDDPIEDCEEAKRLWVIFKEGSGYEHYNPEICFFDGYSVEITNTDGLFASLTDIDRWQLIPTPPMPSNMTEGGNEEAS